MRALSFLAIILLALSPATRAAEPMLRPNDVIALVGGEDMVVAAELGYLETFLQLALPAHHLKVRSLAREGDTVYEQRRDLNYPKLETQLDQIGATVVLCQFGQMESMEGELRSGAFRAAYEKLAARLGNDGKRRLVFIHPVGIAPKPGGDSSAAEKNTEAFREATSMAARNADAKAIEIGGGRAVGSIEDGKYRDQVHLSSAGQVDYAFVTASKLAAISPQDLDSLMRKDDFAPMTIPATLNALVAEKNRLWHHYTRPQNWAFLAGDRTNQPSSRDHRDPSKRWFPAEMAQWLPLIEAAEKRIWAEAEKLAKPEGK